MDPAFEPRPGDLSFAHPPLVRSLAIQGIVICVATLAYVVAMPFLESTAGIHWFIVLCCLVTVVACLVAGIAIVRRSRDTIVVAEDGLWWHSPNAPSVFIAWSEVAAVEPQNVMQRLIVRDRSASRQIPLEFHLQRFGELRRLVTERSAGSTAI